jgi:hypothetical protein
MLRISGAVAESFEPPFNSSRGFGIAGGPLMRHRVGYLVLPIEISRGGIGVLEKLKVAVRYWGKSRYCISRSPSQ